MWDCMESIFDDKYSTNLRVQIEDYLHDYEINNGKEINYNFSRDNFETIICFLKYFNKDKDTVPLFGRHNLHPMRFIRFLWMKYDKLSFLKVINILDIIVRHGILRRKDGNGTYHTSGLLLDYYHAYSYRNKITMKILTYFMSTMFESWYEVFDIYHGNPNHYNYKVLLAFRWAMSRRQK